MFKGIVLQYGGNPEICYRWDEYFWKVNEEVQAVMKADLTVRLERSKTRIPQWD